MSAERHEGFCFARADGTHCVHWWDGDEDGTQRCCGCHYSNEDKMTFGQAIEALKCGEKVQRVGWNGKGMWLALQVPDAHSKMQRPYIYMSDAQGLLVPWLASQTDVLAEDWQAVA